MSPGFDGGMGGAEAPGASMSGGSAVSSGMDPLDTAPGMPEGGGAPYDEMGQGAGSGEQGAIATRIVALDPEGDRHTRIVDVSVPAMVRRKARERDGRDKGVGAEGEDAPPSLFDEASRGFRHFYLRMHRFDRWTLWLLIVSFIGAFLPWERERGVGLVSGVEGVGALTVVTVLAALGTLYWRTERRRLAGILIMLQLFTVAAVVGLPLFLLINQVEEHFVFGLYGTLLGGGLALLFSFARLTRLSA